MVTLTDVRDRLRLDLSDTGAERWPDEQLDRHIEHALGELSLAMPREAVATVATTPGSRDIDVSAIEGLLEVEAVEFPLGQFPPAYPGFATWDQVLSLHLGIAPDGDDAKLYYTATHTLDEEGSTLPESAAVDILVTGAGAYAALELASAHAGVLSLDPAAVERYAAWSRARLTAFRQLLHAYGRKNRVRPRRMYVPA
jgi:hypothetical protein